ncbi:MAG: ComEC/Rec2 family competence protein [Bacteroidia bacterium]
MAVGWVCGLLLVDGTLGQVGAAVGASAALSYWSWKKGFADRSVWGLPLGILTGHVYGLVHKQVPPHHIAHAVGHYGQMTGYLVEDPKPTAKSMRLLVEVKTWARLSSPTPQPATGRIYLYLPKNSPPPRIGEKIRFSGRLEENPYGQVRYRMRVSSVECQGIRKGFLLGYFLRLRQHILTKMQDLFPDRKGAALVEALVLGYRGHLDPEVQESFRLSGAAHILAVSGMHVSLVMSFFLLAIRLLPVGRRGRSFRFLLLGLGLWFFVGLSSASASTVRAACMSSLWLGAWLFFRQGNAVNFLAFSALLQLGVAPALLYQIGFQLSYTAVMGIVGLYPLLWQRVALLLPKNRFSRYVGELLTVSLAAQIGTLPFSLYHFGQFPTYFLLTNLIALPIASVLLGVGLLWAIAIFIPYVNVFLGWVAVVGGEFLIFLLESVARLPGSIMYLSEHKIPIFLVAGFLFLVIMLYAQKGTWRHSFIPA